MANNNITRGTTPTLTFTLPFDVANIAKAYITIAQNGEIVIDKEVGDTGCTCSDKTITYHLTQEETLKLADCRGIEMQIRLRTTNGEVLASQIIKSFVEEILKDGVI